MNKKAIGIDHCKFNLFFKTQQNNNNEVIPIISPHHFEFGEILTERGQLVVSLCLPKYFEIHNAVPFKMNQIKYFDGVIETIHNAIRENFDSPFKTELTSIEMNITEVFKGCDYEKVFLLISHSLLDKLKQNARYEIKSDKSVIKPMTSGVKTRLIKGRYYIKAYDKQKQIESEQGITIPYAPIRIEFVFSKNALKKMFGSRRKLDVVFSKAGLTVLVNAYVETMSEIVNDYIWPYLDRIHEQMLIHLRTCGNIQETYCEFKEVIYDQEQIRKVLKDWYAERNMADNSRSTLAKLNKKFDLPKGTIKVITDFANSIKK